MKRIRIELSAEDTVGIDYLVDQRTYELLVDIAQKLNAEGRFIQYAPSMEVKVVG